jgi:pimeloyl-ACP methyl ester carboxylesterase
MSARRAFATPIDIGRGRPLVVLPGFGLSPQVYGATASLLARQCRVIVTDLYRERGGWSFAETVDQFAVRLDRARLDRVSIMGHSFSGGVELGFAARYPQRVVELVFVDTLAMSREWPLAEEALRHPVRLLWLATPQAALAFGSTVLTYPRRIAEAAWWGFTSGRSSDATVVAGHNLRAHVLWANRDSLLSRDDGAAFARELGASFTIAERRDDAPVDHDWMYRHPQLFVQHVERLGLDVFACQPAADYGLPRSPTKPEDFDAVDPRTETPQ